MTTFRSLGDLSTTFLLSRQTANLKAQIQSGTSELSSGRTSDISATLRGDFRALASMERRISLAETEKLAMTEAQGHATAVQKTLGVVQDTAQTLSSVFLAIPAAPSAPTLDRAGVQARNALESIISALNQQYADRAVFAGDAVDGPAIAPADTILTELESLVSGETTVAGIVDAVDAWFDTPGGGFETLGYLGSDATLAPFRLGEGEKADIGVKADDPALREVMKGLALGVLLESGPLAGDVGQRVALSRIAAERTLSAESRVIDLRASVGDTESRISSAITRASSEAAALEIARNDLVGIDPYDLATRLETAQTQLETLYALTARVSRLSLMDYIR